MKQGLLKPFHKSFADTPYLDVAEGHHLNVLRECPLKYLLGPEKHITGRL